MCVIELKPWLDTKQTKPNHKHHVILLIFSIRPNCHSSVQISNKFDSTDTPGGRRRFHWLNQQGMSSGSWLLMWARSPNLCQALLPASSSASACSSRCDPAA